jgi:hypothetical protein
MGIKNALTGFQPGNPMCSHDCVDVNCTNAMHLLKKQVEKKFEIEFEVKDFATRKNAGNASLFVRSFQEWERAFYIFANHQHVVSRRA